MSDSVPTTWEEVFKHKRFTELNDAKKNAEADLEKVKGQLSDLQTKYEAAQTSAKTAQSELEQLKEGASDVEKLTADLTSLKTQFEQSQTELGKKEAQVLRMQVATENGLPANMANRLQGSTKEELEADAKGLLEYMKPTTPGNPPPTPRTPATPAFTDQQLADPEFVRKNQQKILANQTE